MSSELTGLPSVDSQAATHEARRETRPTRQQGGSLCGRAVKWLWNNLTVSNLIKALVLTTAARAIGNIVSSGPDTSTWNSQCPLSRSTVTDVYGRAFEVRAAHSRTMHALYAPELPAESTATCWTISRAQLVDEVLGTRCWSAGKEVPADTVEEWELDCQVRTRQCNDTCSDSSRASRNSGRRKKLQHEFD